MTAASSARAVPLGVRKRSVGRRALYCASKVPPLNSWMTLLGGGPAVPCPRSEHGVTATALLTLETCTCPGAAPAVEPHSHSNASETLPFVAKTGHICAAREQNRAPVALQHPSLPGSHLSPIVQDSGFGSAAPASLELEKRRVSEGRQGSAQGAVCSRKRQRRPPRSSGRSGVTSVSQWPTRLRVQRRL